MAREDIEALIGAIGGGVGGRLLANKGHEELVRRRLSKEFPFALKMLGKGKLDKDVVKRIAGASGQAKGRGRIGLLGTLLGAGGGAVLAGRLGEPKVNPYEFMQRDKISKLGIRRVTQPNSEAVDAELRRMHARRAEQLRLRGTGPAEMALGSLGLVGGGTAGGAAGGLLGAGASKAVKKVIGKSPGLGGLGILLGIPLGALLGGQAGVSIGKGVMPRHVLAKRAAKRESKKDQSPNILKVILPSMGAGLTVGMGKGYVEKNLESVLKKLMERSPRLAAAKGLKAAPWGAARGITSSLAGIPYTISALLAAREFQKGRK